MRFYVGFAAAAALSALLLAACASAPDQPRADAKETGQALSGQFQ